MTPEDTIRRCEDLTLLAAVRQLGEWCLAHEARLSALRRDPVCSKQVKTLADDISELRNSAMETATNTVPLRSLLRVLKGRISRVGEKDLRPLALLRGLAIGPLAEYYERTQEVHVLTHGDPFPLVSRPLGDANLPLTPHAPTTSHEELLGGTGFRLHSSLGDSPFQIELDYRRRVELDQATWQAATGQWSPPTLATLWPQCDFQEIEWTKTSPTTFFNVRPKKLDLDGILRNLEAAAASTTNENDPAASIAVLPELSLHHSDDLFGALTSDPDLYPEVVVAGSAHEVVDGRNANVSQTYLNGAPLLTQEKYHRLVFSADEEQLNEDIAPDLPFVVRLPSGSITRLAVSVCADLHDGNLRHELENAGVNLWLVPAMTPGLGGFAHAVSALAGANQAISLVANTVAPQKKGQVPFAVLVGMPLQDEASRHYQVPSGGMRFRGVVTLATEASSTRIHQHHWS